MSQRSSRGVIGSLRRSSRHRRLRVWFLNVSIVAVGWFGMQWMVRQMLYPAPPVAVPSPAPAGLEEIWLETELGDRVSGWLATPVGWQGSEGAGPTVLYFHGNGENLETVRIAGLFDEVRRRDAALLAIDYPGYGRSSGRPSEARLAAAGLAAHDWLMDRFGGTRPVVWGWSLGAAVASRVASERPCAALLLASPWHDLRSVAVQHVPELLVELALRDRYASGERAKEIVGRVEGGISIVHGGNDSLIPTEEGRRLWRALESVNEGNAEPADLRLVVVEGAGHNDLLGRDEVWVELDRLLARARGRDLR